MPKGLGNLGDDDHDQLVADCITQEIHYRSLLTPIFDQMQRWWKLYLASRDETRAPNEKWRANIAVPYPYSGVETVVASVLDIINSADPVIQTEGVDDKDTDDAHAVERILDYFLRANKWPSTASMMYRDMCVQGLVVPKLVHVRDSHFVQFHPSRGAISDFKQRVQEGEAKSSTQAPTDPNQFEIWRNLVNTGYNANVPEIPIPGQKEIVRYDGPKIVLPSIFDFRFDPFIDSFPEQHFIMQRIVKPEQWVLDRCKGRDAIFDGKQVEQSLASTAQEGRLLQWDQEIASMLGFDVSPITDPIYQKMQEIFEVWMPGTDHPYGVLLNRKAFINKDSSTTPYMHGLPAYFPIRNVALARKMVGISELQQTEKLYKEMDSLRGLRLDAVTLAVLPILLRLRNAGEMPDIQKFLKPGAFIDIGRPDAVKALTFMSEGLQQAFREMPTIKEDIDETNGTFSNVRGGTPNVGRVSATQSERSFTQAVVRQKERVLRIENETGEMIPQALMLFYQFSDPDVIVRVGGKNPIVKLTRETFMEALDWKFNFRGASKALNREMIAQELMGVGEKFAAILRPYELRSLGRLVLETLNQKHIGDIFTDQGDEETKALATAQIQKELGPPPPPPGAPPEAGPGGSPEPGGPGGSPGAGGAGGAPPPPPPPPPPAGPVPVTAGGAGTGGASPSLLETAPPPPGVPPAAVPPRTGVRVGAPVPPRGGPQPTRGR